MVSESIRVLLSSLDRMRKNNSQDTCYFLFLWSVACADAFYIGKWGRSMHLDDNYLPPIKTTNFNDIYRNKWIDDCCVWLTAYLCRCIIGDEEITVPTEHCFTGTVAKEYLKWQQRIITYFNDRIKDRNTSPLPNETINHLIDRMKCYHSKNQSINCNKEANNQSKYHSTNCNKEANNQSKHQSNNCNEEIFLCTPITWIIFTYMIVKGHNITTEEEIIIWLNVSASMFTCSLIQPNNNCIYSSSVSEVLIILHGLEKTNLVGIRKIFPSSLLHLISPVFKERKEEFFSPRHIYLPPNDKFVLSDLNTLCQRCCNNDIQSLYIGSEIANKTLNFYSCFHY